MANGKFDIAQEYGQQETAMNPLDMLAQAAAAGEPAALPPPPPEDQAVPDAESTDNPLSIPGPTVTEIKALAKAQKYSEIGQLIASFI